MKIVYLSHDYPIPTINRRRSGFTIYTKDKICFSFQIFSKEGENLNNQNSKRTYLFEKAPVPKAVLSLVIPTVISQIITIIYNFADTWFVGRTGDDAAVAAVSVAMPLFIVMTGLSNLFGIGGAGVISRSLGKKNTQDARKAFAFSLWTSIGVAIIYSVIIFFFGKNLVSIIGGNSESEKYILNYLFWTIVVGGVPTMLVALLGHLVRASGKAKASGFFMSLGAVLNIILDPIFMFVLLPKGNEVTGAALATMLSNTLAAAAFIIYVKLSKDDVFTLNIRDYSLKKEIVSDVLGTGAPACLSTCLAMVSNIAANKLMSDYTNAAVAGLGIAKKANTLAFHVNLGLTQGVLPLIGYNYAAKNFDRMKKTIGFTFGVAIGFSVICTLVYRTFPGQITKFFINDAETIAEGTKLLPTLSVAVVFCAMTYLMNTIFQATGQKLYSLLTSIMRKGIFDIPLMFLFKHYWQETGIVAATPTAEVLSIFVSLFLLFRFFGRLKKQAQNV